MEYLKGLLFGKNEETSTGSVPGAPLSSGTAIGSPQPAVAGRRRRRSGKTMKAGQKAGRRHRRKHSRRA